MPNYYNMNKELMIFITSHIYYKSMQIQKIRLLCKS